MPVPYAQALLRRLAQLPRLARHARGASVEQEDVVLVSTAGYQLPARVTRLRGAPAGPGLVVSPAIHQGREGLERTGSPVTSSELARIGYTVLTFDPAGRGDAWGEDDFGGPEHADDVRCAVRWLAERPGVPWVGVLSLSLGVAAATAALSGPDAPEARWLVDWEGPCDREIITAGGTRMVPADGHTLDDDAYWNPREAVRHVGALRCGYVRLQAVPDHAQPEELRHAQRMMHAASVGLPNPRRPVEPGTLPWFQLNDHPRGTVPPRPAWLRGGNAAANTAILRKLTALRVT
jgi:hypothetical protein